MFKTNQKESKTFNVNYFILIVLLLVVPCSCSFRSNFPNGQINIKGIISLFFQHKQCFSINISFHQRKRINIIAPNFYQKIWIKCFRCKLYLYRGVRYHAIFILQFVLSWLIHSSTCLTRTSFYIYFLCLCVWTFLHVISQCQSFSNWSIRPVNLCNI